jgi:DNA-binding transcriptional LysR family regulator
MEFKQIEYFLQVVDSGSFSEAAYELYISQSSLSKKIIALEQEIGVSLFDRSKRKITLTPAGVKFLPHARKMEADYRAMIEEVAQYKPTPTLTIAAIPVIAQYGILSLISRFEHLHPEVHLVLEEREASEMMQDLNNHKYDLVFTRDNFLDMDNFDSVEILNDHLVVVLSLQHPLANRSQLSLTELNNENFIMFDKGTTVHEVTVNACRQAGFEPRIFYASLRVESILSMVASNSGVALMMKKIFDYHINPQLVEIPLIETISSRIVLASLKKRKLSPAANTFIDYMKRSTISERD